MSINCTKCGKELPDGAKWCCWCGLKNPGKPQSRQPKSRGNGQGSVYKDSQRGTWTAAVTLGYYEGKAKRRTKKGFKTKKEALEYLAALKDPNYSSWRDRSIKAIWDAMSGPWLDELSQGKAGHYKLAWKRLEPLWGQDIKNLIAQDWQDALNAFPEGHEPRKDGKVVASKIYQYAMAQGWVQINMAEHIRLPKQAATNKDAFTREELDKLWKSWQAGNEWAAYILIMCYTGMRPGELRKIRLDDIHLDQHYMVGGIKSKAGIDRCIPFPAFLRPVISWAMERSQSNKLLSCAEAKFYEFYYGALDQAGIQRTEARPMTPHCCRHTFMSQGTEAGIQLAVLQKMAGHSDPSVTALYVHAHDPALISAAQKLYKPDFVKLG